MANFEFGRAVGRQIADRPVEVSDKFPSLRVVVARILSAEWHSDTLTISGCFMWLRSAVGERGSGAESGEKRIAHRSRSETAAAEPQTEARRSCGSR